MLDALQQRGTEREGLAGARAGLADDVVAAQRDRQGELLDGERFYDALCFKGVCYLGDDPEFTKGSQGFQPPICGVSAPGCGAAPGGRHRVGTPA
ncbi:hypothetical protein ACN3XK_14380 [Actinomadura welshii]